MTDVTASEGSMPKLENGETYLCVLAEHGNRRFDLVQQEDTFRIRASDGRSTDRDFESLPALLAGLQSFFLEFRVSSAPVKGFSELAQAQASAREDVIEASRRIYAALDANK